MLAVVAHLGPGGIGVMGSQRLGPFRPFLCRVAGDGPEGGGVGRLPAGLGGVGLHTAVELAAVLPELAHRVVDIGRPFRKEQGLLRGSHGVNGPGLRQHHKGDGGGVPLLLCVELGLMQRFEAGGLFLNCHY